MKIKGRYGRIALSSYLLISEQMFDIIIEIKVVFENESSHLCPIFQ